MVKDLKYIKEKDTFLDYAYRALSKHFTSRKTFDNYFNAIKTKEQKNLFLKTASFYLFLVKNGDWFVDIPNPNTRLDYLTNTYKYLAIFSLIEALFEDRYIDFYHFLMQRKSAVQFPIVSKDKLGEYYVKYKDKYGAIKRCISFFKALSLKRQNDLISKLTVNGTTLSIEDFAKYLYDLRSKFVHNAELILHVSEGTTVGLHPQKKNKVITCSLSISDLMTFFEEGLKIHFQTKQSVQIDPDTNLNHT